MFKKSLAAMALMAFMMSTTWGNAVPQACSPGYWKNHLDAWAPTGYAPGDEFGVVFGVLLFEPAIALEEAIRAKGGGNNKVARHGTAALLSASHPDLNYLYTAAEVIAFVQAGDIDPLATANEEDCPL
jgi:hypothetical protein